MVMLEHYWLSNEDWWHREEYGKKVINDDAPPEAKRSYEIYLEQLKSAIERGVL